MKEGLTVFRDAEFTSDLNSRTAKLIQDAKVLRQVQYPEDAGPLAHPIRPASYQNINNFYTSTVYEKGAQVIRMIFTIVGAEGFRSGLNLYFSRHDGQAVTCEEFVKAMEDANGVDLSQFLRSWYSQAGTPALTVTTEYNADAKTLVLNVKQSCEKAAMGSGGTAAPFEIPLKIGLIGSVSGENLDVKFEPKDVYPSHDSNDRSAILRVQNFEHSFVIKNVCEKPIPSLLRGFSGKYFHSLSLSPIAISPVESLYPP